jgi:hypothetical protein
MKKIVGIILVVSLIVNLILGWLVFTKIPLGQNEKIEYESSVIAIKQATQYIASASNKADKHRVSDLFLALDRVSTALLFINQYQNAFLGNRINVDELELALQDMRFDLTIATGEGIDGKPFDDAKIQSISSELSHMSIVLPTKYNASNINKAMQSLH